MTYDDRTKHFIKEIRNISQIIDLRLTNKALSLLLESMNAANGFTRHDGSDYYVHPIAVAQTALDFQLIANRIRAGKVEEADLLLAGCLLHDYLEDVNPDKFAFVDRFDAGLGEQLYNIVLNVTKTGLSTEKYIAQVSSNPVSALIKIIDRLNNFSTLSESTTQHRKHQLEETEAVYLPLTEQFRVEFWEDASFYWQAKTIMEAIARELHRYFNDMDFKDLEMSNA